MPCFNAGAEVVPLYSHTSVMDRPSLMVFSAKHFSYDRFIAWEGGRGGYLSVYLSGDAICHSYTFEHTFKYRSGEKNTNDTLPLSRSLPVRKQGEYWISVLSLFSLFPKTGRILDFSTVIILPVSENRENNDSTEIQYSPCLWISPAEVYAWISHIIMWLLN